VAGPRHEARSSKTRAERPTRRSAFLHLGVQAVGGLNLTARENPEGIHLDAQAG